MIQHIIVITIVILAIIYTLKKIFKRRKTPDNYKCSGNCNCCNKKY